MYASPYPSQQAFRAANKFFPGEHSVVPIPIGRADRPAGFAQESPIGGEVADSNLDIDTYDSRQGRNYATPYGTSANFENFWNENHIFPGSLPPGRNNEDQFGNAANSLSQGNRDDDQLDVGAFHTYSSPYPSQQAWRATQKFLPGEHGTIPQTLGQYAGEDDQLDVSGTGANRMYASPYESMKAWRDKNQFLNPGEKSTVPIPIGRADRPAGFSQALAEGNNEGNGDTNLDIGTYPNQKTRNYSTPYGTNGNM